MYVPKRYEMSDRERALRLVEDYPFATLVALAAGRLEAAHVPCAIVRGGTGGDRVLFHLAVLNPLAQELDGSRPALLVFTGPHTYVSPDWYDTPGLVPTWNYAVVHVGGTPARVDDEALQGLLETLSARQEARLVKQAWTPAKVPDDRYAAMRRAIVGFEMALVDVQAKWKMSQNQTPADRRGVVAALRERTGEHEASVAREMESFA